MSTGFCVLAVPAKVRIWKNLPALVLIRTIGNAFRVFLDRDGQDTDIRQMHLAISKLVFRWHRLALIVPPSALEIEWNSPESYPGHLL